MQLYMDPVAFHLGPLTVHWYGIMYLLAFINAWFLLQYLAKQETSSSFNQDLNGDLLFYGGLGVIIGGRFGYALFYGLDYWMSDFWWPFRFWERGMSFHGGLIGVLAALGYVSYKYRLPFLRVTDQVALCVPLGLFFGRLGNLINGELWGRATTMPWGIIFPEGGPLPRHPSQLYEAFGEGIVLFGVLWWFYRYKTAKKTGQLSGLFLVGYALARIIVECFREPDPQYGYLAVHWLTMGQLLSFPMIFIGVYLLILRNVKCNNITTY